MIEADADEDLRSDPQFAFKLIEQGITNAVLVEARFSASIRIVQTDPDAERVAPMQRGTIVDLRLQWPDAVSVSIRESDDRQPRLRTVTVTGDEIMAVSGDGQRYGRFDRNDMPGSVAAALDQQAMPSEIRNVGSMLMLILEPEVAHGDLRRSKGPYYDPPYEYDGGARTMHRVRVERASSPGLFPYTERSLWLEEERRSGKLRPAMYAATSSGGVSPRFAEQAQEGSMAWTQVTKQLWPEVWRLHHDPDDAPELFMPPDEAEEVETWEALLGENPGGADAGPADSIGAVPAR